MLFKTVMVWAEKGQILAGCICVHAVAGVDGKIRHNQVVNTVSLIFWSGLYIH